MTPSRPQDRADTVADEEVVAAWAVLDSAGVTVSRRQVRRALLTAVRVRGQMAEIQASVGAAVVVPDEEILGFDDRF